MVREATNVSAQEALDAGLIDLIAGDQTELLSDLDGFAVKGPKAGDARHDRLLGRASATCRCRYELLQILVNPNVAYLLLLIGMIGIALEFGRPGHDRPRRCSAASPSSSG